MNPAEQEWVNGIRQGDPEILGALLQQCRPDLKRRIEDRLKGASIGCHISVSDIVQNACLQAYKEHAQFQGTSMAEWTLWVRKIATNYFLMELRKKVQPQCSLDEIVSVGSDPVFEQLINSTVCIADKVIDREKLLILRAAVQGLSSRDQKLVHFRFQNDLSWDEIGAKLGCTGKSAWRRYKHSILPELELRLDILNDPD